MLSRKSHALSCSVAVTAVLCICLPSIASADEVIIETRRPRRDRIRYEETYDRPAALYPVELEGHFAVGPENVYGNVGLGGGARLSIPLVVGFSRRRDFSDNLAISFGADALHYDNCYYSNRCSATYLQVPVVAQFNWFFGRHFALFGEAGGFFYRGFFNECLPGDVNCNAPRDLGVLPDLAIGLRAKGEHVAFIARLGYPTSTLGISFL
jgi:hypothetical protein